MLYIKSNIHKLQIHAKTLRILSLNSLILICGIFGATYANASSIDESTHVLELIDQVETYRQQESSRLQEQRYKAESKSIGTVDIKSSEHLYSPLSTLNQKFDDATFNSGSTTILSDMHFFPEQREAHIAGEDLQLFSDTDLNNLNIDVERIN